jgi:hypothetical protein
VHSLIVPINGRTEAATTGGLVAQTPPHRNSQTAVACSQHEALALTTLARIVRYAEADFEAGLPSVEHAEQILAAAGTYLRETVALRKDMECSARHDKAA